MSCRSLGKPKLGGTVGTEIITIGVGVGDKRQSFSVHRALLQKFTTYFDKYLATEAGQKGFIFLNDEDPDVFADFHNWLYTGLVKMPPTRVTVKNWPPPEAEAARLEADLLQRFNAREWELVDLYILGEKYEISHLRNKAIDTIQDGYHEYGTVFGPGLVRRIFTETKHNSKLRDLCIASTLLHTDRGCCQLRGEIMDAAFEFPNHFSHMMTWISQNFHLFGRRQREGFDVTTRTGFSVLNRHELCACHFHDHAPGEAHANHKKCAVPFKTCGHTEEDQEDSRRKYEEKLLKAFGPEAVQRNEDEGLSVIIDLNQVMGGMGLNGSV